MRIGIGEEGENGGATRSRKDKQGHQDVRAPIYIYTSQFTGVYITDLRIYLSLHIGPRPPGRRGPGAPDGAEAYPTPLSMQKIQEASRGAYD
eukprot:239528-Pyramimonas_sp.AAC.1